MNAHIRTLNEDIEDDPDGTKALAYAQDYDEFMGDEEGEEVSRAVGEPVAPSGPAAEPPAWVDNDNVVALKAAVEAQRVAREAELAVALAADAQPGLHQCKCGSWWTLTDSDEA